MLSILFNAFGDFNLQRKHKHKQSTLDLIQ